MQASFPNLPELDRHVQTLSATDSPAEVFKILRDAGRLAAPRGAVFLIRRGRVQGWSGFGHGSDVLKAQREWSCGFDEGWPGEMLSRPETPLFRRNGPGDPDYGQQPAAEAVGAVVRIQGKPIALVVAEREAGEEPWHPETFSLLITVAQMRLELDLALRKLQTATDTHAQPAPRPAAPAAAAAPTRPAPAPAEVTPPSPAREEVAVAVPEEAAETVEPELDAAKRYARLVATDIRLYNEEAVALGRRNGDLLQRLEEHLGRGKDTFLRRHADLGETGIELLRDAYVQVLAGGDASLIPSEYFVANAGR